MIQLSGRPFTQNSLGETGKIENDILKSLQRAPGVYSYQSINELRFELRLRKNIIQSARALNKSNAKFQIFSSASCNPNFWYLTPTGGFQLKPGVNPSIAIQDIFTNGSLYAFECATAIVIVYYHAVLQTLGTNTFNRLFQNIYLYSWHGDSDLGINTFYGNHYIPGDVVYFNNPDFHPQTPWFRGLNAVSLDDNTFYGHGFDIRTNNEILKILNEKRRPQSHQKAYLSNLVTRLSFRHLEKYSYPVREYSPNKIQRNIIHHNKSSISHDHYMFYLYQTERKGNTVSPFFY